MITNCLQSVVLLLWVFTADVTLVQAQQQKRIGSRAELISPAREVMKTARYCALITTNPRGGVDARTMDAFAPDEKMICMARNQSAQSQSD